MPFSICQVLEKSGFNVYLIELLILCFSSNIVTTLLEFGTFSLAYLRIDILNNKINFQIISLTKYLKTNLK